MNRIDTGLKIRKTVKDELKEQEDSFSECDQKQLLETIKVISEIIKKRKYSISSIPDLLLLGRFILSRGFKTYNASLAYSQEKCLNSDYSEEERGIPIEIPKKRIFRTLKENGYNILFSGVSLKSGKKPLHTIIVFNKEKGGKDFELKIYPDGVLFPRNSCLYTLTWVLNEIHKKSKENLTKRKEFEKQLELPYLEQEMKNKIIQYDSGESSEKIIEISEYDGKILDYLGELCNCTLKHSTYFKFCNFIVRDNDVIGITLPRSQLIEFPAILLNFEHLEKLDLNTNEINVIPKEIKKLKNLQELNLSVNNIKILPESIGKLENLVELQISENQLRSLPYSFMNLKSLRKLNLECNNFEDIPESIYNLNSLEELNYLGNNIKRVSEKIVNLKSVKSLTFGSANMTNIPYPIYMLTNLERLFIICNDSANLTENISNLHGLKWLDLQVDTISTFPESFGKLNALENLTLYSEKGTKLPIQLLELESLKMITFIGEISNVIKHGFENDCLTEDILDELYQNGVGLYIP
jgi:hypothetical protein